VRQAAPVKLTEAVPAGFTLHRADPSRQIAGVLLQCPTISGVSVQSRAPGANPISIVAGPGQIEHLT
jgi:hypothetical protein